MATMRRVLGIALLLGALPLAAQEEVETQGKAAKPSEAAAQRLAAMRQAVDGLKGVKGDERATRLRALAADYEALAAEFEGEPVVAARAHYEAGELWRRCGEVTRAEAAYGRALEKDDGRLRERALFQRAEMQRRSKDYETAIASYRAAAEVRPDGARAHEARVWIGRCLELQGEREQAVAAYRAALEATTDPVRGIDACNRLAQALLAAGDLPGAQAAVAEAERRTQAAVEAGGSDAERAQKAFERMSARRALQRAADEQSGAGKDAARLDAERRGG